MTNPSPNPRDPNRHVPAILLIALGLFAVYLLRYVLLPFVIAGALALVAVPAVRGMHERWHWPRWIGALLIFCGYALVFALVGWGIARFALPQAAAVLQDLPRILHRFLSTLFRGETTTLIGIRLDASELSQRLSTWLPSQGAAPDPLLSAAGIGVAVLMGGILTLVLLLYFLIEAPRLSRGAVWLTPPAQRERVLNVARRSRPVLYRYVVGILVVVSYTIFATWIFARLGLHLPQAELLAVAVGLLEMIPVAGPALSVAMIALIAIEQITFGMIIGVSVFAIFLRLSIDQFIGPIVLGKATHLPPPLIIFAFLAGGAIYGALGVLIAIPVLAVGKIVIEEMRAEPTLPNLKESYLREQNLPKV